MQAIRENSWLKTKGNNSNFAILGVRLFFVLVRNHPSTYATYHYKIFFSCKKATELPVGDLRLRMKTSYKSDITLHKARYLLDRLG